MKVKSLFIISKSGLFLKALENYYKKTEISVFTINDAIEALHFIKDLNPDVVLINHEDFSKEEAASVKNTAKFVVTLVEEIDNGADCKQLQLPINPAQLIISIEELYKV